MATSRYIVVAGRAVVEEIDAENYEEALRKQRGYGTIYVNAQWVADTIDDLVDGVLE